MFNALVYLSLEHTTSTNAALSHTRMYAWL